MTEREYFGTSGIRGRVGADVDADLALTVGRALASEADRVVVGRDARTSGSTLVDALSAGLTECGTDVVDVGVEATPTVARGIAERDADAGVVVTASHNPPRDNGLKLWQPSGQAYDRSGQDRLVGRIRTGDFDRQSWDALGERSSWTDARTSHVEAIAGAVEVSDPPSVVVDLGNGAGGVSVEALQAIGCSIETLNAQPDGRFPGRPSEPTAENCSTLAATVAATDADLGIAHDGDADRMMAVTGDGEFVPGDVLLALFAREAIEQGDRVAVPVDTSLLVADALEDVGAEVVLTRVGDVFVAERAREGDVVFGGEPSGAWIFPEDTLCPDGPLAAAKLVELVADAGPLAAQVDSIDRYPIRRTTFEVSEKAAVMERVATAVRADYDDVNTLDGVRVELGDAWFLVRASGTEPRIRVTAEARNPERADAVFETASGLVEDHLRTD
ncbi:phosphoglucosamine mutase [Halorubrum sp. 48-1-W]|uniref:phosphoglucosamine mutase n=1 Tax=Halorubrum sp. 48-1-W TaxID=2249761 RepID=UPI000DCC9E27|nr:phosphoglucosamine mutase [Halorubrum sp. 48-1-W]RAW46193.1 phosphoglucosamine mutase [Halorubrum sp. 48-1-W]